MPYYALVSEECLADAARTGFAQEIPRLALKIEGDQSTGTWDKFLPTPFIRKVLGTFRVLAELRPLDGDAVVILRRVIARGDAAYERFLENPNSLGRSPTDQEIRDWLLRRTAQHPIELPPATDFELAYLYDNSREDFGEVILETSEWFSRMGRIEKEALPFLYRLLIDKVLVGAAPQTALLIENDAGILYRRLPHLNRVVLIAPFFGRRSRDEEAEIRRRHTPLLEGSFDTDAEIRRRCRRAYPSVVLADVQLWLRIESDETSNLALSPEEAQILESVAGGDPATPAYPLFINGRPGSGKSTVLKYLFAEHLARHLSRDELTRTAAPPLYLTYSDALLKDALDTAKRLLSSNASLQMMVPEDSASPALESAFQLFHQYLRGLLTPGDRARFEERSRLAFPDFRDLWRRRSSAAGQGRSLSAELAWHVIRSYIKGMRGDDGAYCDPDMYAELPKKRRTVTLDTYTRIYEDVFRGWFGQICEQEGLWDDQDLTRAVLDNVREDVARHPVVFCDEAQDFTRIELELIARLCLFTRRSISPQDLRRIPFAFAGDPFQTLNPTGFQWSSVQAGFHEQIVQAVDRAGSAHLKFNFQELSFNYRSTRPIVGLSNLIQALRGILFDIPGLHPQRSWSDEGAAIPALFCVDDPKVREELERHDELIVILPCQEGMEDAFVVQDELLSKLRSVGSKRNFLSPMAAKGLEFSRVVLYKFGQEQLEAYAQLFDPFGSGESHMTNPEQALPLEYFVNRLYVAATRAKRVLLIVDTADGLETFWRARHIRDLQAFLGRLPRSDVLGWTIDDLTVPQPGSAANWTEDRDDPEQLGRQFFEEGLASRSVYLMSLAEANFRRAGRHHDALRSAAHKNLFDEDFAAAGAAYMELGERAEALRCFWNAERYDLIVKDFGTEKTIYASAASLLRTGNASSEQAERFLEGFYDELVGPQGQRLVADRKWQKVLAKVVEGLAEASAVLTNLDVVFARLKEIHARGIHFAKGDAYASLAYKASDFASAVASWDSVKRRHDDGEEYWIAKAKVEAYPARIHWLGRLKDSQGIVDEYVRNPSIPLNERDVNTVVQALLSVGKPEDAVALAETQGVGHPLLATLADKGLVAGDLELARAAITSNLRVLARGNRWKEAALFLMAGKVSGRIRADVVWPFVREIAFSDRKSAGIAEVTAVLDEVRDRTNEWEGDRLMLLGAAYERISTHTAALSFYEAVWQARRIRTDHRNVEHARIRWCRCKYKFADRLVSQNRKADADRHRLEADGQLVHLGGLRISDIPDFPEIRRPSKDEFAEVRPDAGTSTELDTKRDGILALMSQNWSVEKIAQAVSLPIEVVQHVIRAPGGNVPVTPDAVDGPKSR